MKYLEILNNTLKDFSYPKAILLLVGLFLLDVFIWWLFNRERRKLKCLLHHKWIYSDEWNAYICKNCGIGQKYR